MGILTDTPTLQATWDAVMSQDVVMTAGIPVASTSQSPVGVFTNPASGGQANNPAVEALVALAPQGGGGPQLAHVARNPSTDAGWGVVTLFGGVSATAVTAGTTYAGTSASAVVGFFQGDSFCVIQLGSDGATWSQPTTLSTESISRLCTAYSPAGRLVAYGSTGGGDLIVAYQPTVGGAWTAGVTAMSGALSSGDFVLTMVDESDWQIAANVEGTPVIFTGTLGQSTTSSSGQAQGFTGTLAQVVLGYWSSSQQTLLYLLVDTDQTLNVWALNQASSTPVNQQIPNSDVSSAAGQVALDGTLHVYSIDGDGGLWVLHQDPNTPWNDDGTPNFAPYIPLDTGIGAVAGDMTPTDAPSLFALDSIDYSLRFHSQDPVTLMWQSGPVLQSQPAAYELVRFRTQLSLVDSNGIPVPNYPVAVQVAEGFSATSLSAGGQTVPVSSQAPVTLTTDCMGRLTIAVLTTAGMVAPNLVVTADGLADPITLSPAGPVHTYLSGNGTLNPTNPGGPLPVFDADGNTLTGASVGGSPLAPGLSGNPTLAAAAAKAIQNTATVGLGQVAPGVAGFAARLRHADGPSFTLIDRAEELQAHLERLRPAAGGSAASGTTSPASSATSGRGSRTASSRSPSSSCASPTRSRPSPCQSARRSPPESSSP